jgi:hypothetical protein
MRRRILLFGEIVTVLVLGFVSFSFLSIRTANAQAGQTTLTPPSDDTYVDSSNPSSNYGGQAYLQIENWQYTVQNQTYEYESIVWLKFNLSSVPSGAVVDEATLQLYTSIVGETFNVHAYSCSNNSWTELTLTYSNMPSYNTTSMDSVLVATGYQWYNWSVVDDVRNALNSNSKAVTIVLLDPSPHSSAETVWFESKEYLLGSAPQLTVHWSSVTPEFPVFLILPFFMVLTLIAVTLYKKKAISWGGPSWKQKRSC